MDKIIPNCCPRCNSKKLYKYGKDRFGNQKYQCPICKHQFAPDTPKKECPRKYPSCPVCGKSAFLHHDYDDYSNYRCSDKKCNHSFFQAKPTVKQHLHNWDYRTHASANRKAHQFPPNAFQYNLLQNHNHST